MRELPGVHHVKVGNLYSLLKGLNLSKTTCHGAASTCKREGGSIPMNTEWIISISSFW